MSTTTNPDPLTPEEIQAYINEAMSAGLKSALSEFSAHFKSELGPVLSRLDAIEEIATTPQVLGKEDPEVLGSDPETAALLQRIQKMEKIEQERQDEMSRMKFAGALDKAVGKHNPQFGQDIKDLLALRLGTAIEKAGEWYLPSGSKLAEEVDTFFASDIGKHFLANPAGQGIGGPGGVTVGLGALPPKDPKDITAEEMLKDWVL